MTSGTVHPRGGVIRYIAARECRDRNADLRTS
jgi:hypothetical protein